MVDYCCCALKPKSFYLLMIFVSCFFFMTPLVELSYVGLKEAQYSLMATFAIFIYLAVLYYNVLSIIAFFHYVIYDGIKHGYCSFYVLNMRMMVFILAVLHLAFFLSFIINPGKSEGSTIAVVSIYFVIVLAFLVLMFFWSTRLNENMPKLDDDVQQPIDEESETNEKAPKQTEQVTEQPKEKQV